MAWNPSTLMHPAPQRTAKRTRAHRSKTGRPRLLLSPTKEPPHAPTAEASSTLRQ